MYTTGGIPCINQPTNSTRRYDAVYGGCSSQLSQLPAAARSVQHLDAQLCTNQRNFLRTDLTTSTVHYFNSLLHLGNMTRRISQNITFNPEQTLNSSPFLTGEASRTTTVSTLNFSTGVPPKHSKPSRSAVDLAQLRPTRSVLSLPWTPVELLSAQNKNKILLGQAIGAMQPELWGENW